MWNKYACSEGVWRWSLFYPGCKACCGERGDVEVDSIQPRHESGPHASAESRHWYQLPSAWTGKISFGELGLYTNAFCTTACTFSADLGEAIFVFFQDCISLRYFMNCFHKTSPVSKYLYKDWWEIGEATELCRDKELVFTPTMVPCTSCTLVMVLKAPLLVTKCDIIYS